MKYDKFFALAKEAGIEDADLYIGQSYDLSVSLFHGEVDNYSNNNSFGISARGIINGKAGAASCDVWSNEKAKYLVNEIVANAKVIESLDPVVIFPGSPKYKKVSTYNKDLEKVSIDDKMAKLYEMERKLKEYDPRIIEVGGVEYSESKSVTTIMNSKGLKLVQKSNYFVYVAQVAAKEGEQIKTNYDVFLGNKFEEFDIDSFVKKVAQGALDQLGGEACESATYKAVLAPGVVRALMSAYINSADAEEVQKKSSLFIGKLDQKVASSKVTIEDKPLDKTLFARGFDDEGVATYNKAIVKNGVLKTYLYNLTTAAKEGVESTGNGVKAGGKMGVSPCYLVLKPGKKNQEELFKQVGDGVYISDVQGLHAGLNAQSGNFSLQSTGFLIKDGKKDRGLDIITVSGNLVDIFKDVVEVGSDVETSPSGVSAPSVMIKKIVVSGK